MTQPGALLFDLGNVVFRIDLERVFARWAEHAGCDAALLRDRFSHDEPTSGTSAARSMPRRTSRACASRLASISMTPACSMDGVSFSSRRCPASASATHRPENSNLWIHQFQSHACCALRSAICAGAQLFPGGVRLLRDRPAEAGASGRRLNRERDRRVGEPHSVLRAAGGACDLG
jgi:hypothetical protein